MSGWREFPSEQPRGTKHESAGQGKNVHRLSGHWRDTELRQALGPDHGKPWGLTTASRRLNGSVYFIGGETGCIKIGWTGQSAEQRCKDLQCGSPIKLSVLAVARGGMSIEREYHQRFKGSRAHGEWFERTPELLAEIDRLNR